MKAPSIPGLDHVGRLCSQVIDWGTRLSTPKALPEAAEIAPPSPRVVDVFSAISRWSGVVALVIGYHGLLGWVFGVEPLRTPNAGIPPMTAYGALASLLAGTALFAIQAPRRLFGDARDQLVSTCGVLVLMLVTVSFVSQITGGPIARSGDAMAFASASAFLAIGVGLVAVGAYHDYGVAQAMGLVSAAIALQAITGYLYGATAIPGQMPLYSAITGLMGAIGLVFVRADRGFMAQVASDSPGGAMARRLLPVTLLIPVALGWLQLRGRRAGLFTLEPGLALFTVANVAVLVAVVWWGVVSLYRMDTKWRQSERELNDTAARLSRSNADLEQFAYVASHDLKEPLRAISGSVQVLQSRLGTQIGPDADEVLRHTVDGANRMQTLIDDLLTYSRLTSREAPLEPTDCNEVLHEAISNLEVPIAESRVIVTSDPLPTVNGDRTQLLQVFQNLMSNAIKYRSARTPKIHVSAEEHEREWVFSVRDNGIGIAPQYADRIFRIFQRLHTRKDYPGTGIGLAVCKKVVERHGGRIWVESEPEEGSTFFFSIPK